MDKQEHTDGSAPQKNKDIGEVLKGWDFEPGTVSVRKITGDDGQSKLQMRLDLGLLQMELAGRPDGERPHGFESLLDYFEERLAKNATAPEPRSPFRLSERQCAQLRDEAEMYYRRYLCLFVMEEYDAVARDTSRNLRVLDLCRKYARRREDRIAMEPYRPYITMMHTRALASVLCNSKRHVEALETVREGLKRIKRYFRKYGRAEDYTDASEVKILKRLGQTIRQQLPPDPLAAMEKALAKAVREERYEEAAKLRDELSRLQLQRPSS